MIFAQIGAVFMLVGLFLLFIAAVIEIISL
jgi:hypothetical protein